MYDQLISTISGFCKRCRIVIEPFVVLQTLATVIATTTESQYILHVIAKKHGAVIGKGSQAMSQACEASNSNNTNHSLERDLQDTQQEANNWNTYFSVTSTIPTMVVIIILGRCADQLGHKKLLVINAIINTAVCIFDTFALAFDWPIWMLLVSNVVYGCAGSIQSVMAFSYAYLCDMTAVDDRQVRISILAFATGFAYSVFGIANGYLIKVVGYTYTMFFCNGFAALSLIYIVFLVPPKPPLPANIAQYDDLSTSDTPGPMENISIWESLKTIHRPIFHIVMPLLIYFLDAFQSTGTLAMTFIYVMGFPFCFDSVELGNYTAIFGIIGLFATLAAITLLSGRLHSMLLVAICSTFSAVGSTIFALARSRTVLYISGVFSMFAGVNNPVLRTFISLNIPAAIQNTMFAILAFISTGCSVVSQPIFNGIYNLTLRWMRGFVFFICVLLSSVCVIVALITYVGTRSSGEQLLEETSETQSTAETSEIQSTASPLPSDRSGDANDHVGLVSNGVSQNSSASKNSSSVASNQEVTTNVSADHSVSNNNLATEPNCDERE